MIELLRDRHGPGCEVLTEYPHQFVRATYGQYVHRPRSGAKYTRHTSLTMWCGMNLGTRGVIGADRVADFGDRAELCGTCEGRFLGSLDNTGLIFQPSNSVDHWRPSTKWCPGPNQGLYVVTGPGSVAVCLLCGALGTERARNGWTSWGSQMTRHRYASERPKVFCPTCGYRDLRLDQLRDGRLVVRCSMHRCGWQTRPFKARARRRMPLMPPLPTETRYPLPPPVLNRFEAPEDNFDDLFD